MKHELTQLERTMLLAIAQTHHERWAKKGHSGHRIMRSISASREGYFGLVQETTSPDCGFLALMVLIEQHGVANGDTLEYTMADGHILQLSKVTISRDREGWGPKFSTLVDEPKGYDRPAMYATRSGCLWVQDAMHNSYEIGADEVQGLLESVGVEERKLLERMIEDATHPISGSA